MVSFQYYKLSWVLIAFAVCCSCSPVAAYNMYNSGGVRGVKNMKRLLRTNPNHIPVIYEDEDEVEGDEQQEKANKYKDSQTGDGDEEEADSSEGPDSDGETEDKSEKYKESTKAAKWTPNTKPDKAGKKTKACKTKGTKKTTKGEEEPSDEIESSIEGEPCSVDSSQNPQDEASTGDETAVPTTEPTNEDSDDVPGEPNGDTDEKNPSEPPSSDPSLSEPTSAPRPSSTDGTDDDVNDDDDDGSSTSAEEANGMTLHNPTGTPTSSPSQSMPPVVESFDEACQTLPNGSFGATTAESLQVKFFFQVETFPSVTQHAVNEALLPLLEEGIGGRLLSFLFEECRQAVSSRGESSTVCDAQGYSSFPQDRVLDGGEFIITIIIHL